MKNADSVKIHPNPNFVIPAKAGIQVKGTGPRLVSRNRPVSGCMEGKIFIRILKKNSGFNVIELIVTLVIVGIVAGTAVVLMGSPTNMRSAAEAEALKANLRFTQSKAMSDLSGNVWSLNITANNYTIQRNDVTPNPAVSLPGSNSGTYTLPAGLSITGGTGQMRFNFRGQPVDGVGNLLAANSNITMVGGSTITVTRQTGFIP
jgi:prepilin-type N-terminal cleavage/methylation domain-containing protein